MNVCICMRTEVKERLPIVFFICYPPWFLRQGLSISLNSLSQVGCRTSEPQRFTCVCLLSKSMPPCLAFSLSSSSSFNTGSGHYLMNAR